MVKVEDIPSLTLRINSVEPMTGSFFVEDIPSLTLRINSVEPMTGSFFCGGYRSRTDDLLRARQAL